MADTFRYKAFISYSHADERWGTWLHRALERYRVPTYLATKHQLPKAPLRPVFRDREELASSSSLSESIETALAASENLIVVCSPAAAESKWVNEEIKAFERLGRGDRVFCLIVGGSDDDCFPEALTEREPLAADIREGADSRQDAKLRLISGLLNIHFGELKNREQKARMRLLGASLGASLAVTGVMTMLAVAAVTASNQAERQFNNAQKAYAAARRSSDEYTQFMKAFKRGDRVAFSLKDVTNTQGPPVRVTCVAHRSDAVVKETVKSDEFGRSLSDVAKEQSATSER
jgi:hypothetical protein